MSETATIPKPTLIGQTDRLFILNFPVGYYEQVPDNVAAANARIDAALKALKGDLALVEQWNGGLSYYKPHGRMVNPEITPEMRGAFIAEALRLYPGRAVLESWTAISQGQNSFSVKLMGSPT